MRITTLALAACLLALPAVPALACGASVQATVTSQLAAKKKPMEQAVKQKDKAEYVPAAPAK